jgi:hypothetical protein
MTIGMLRLAVAVPSIGFAAAVWPPIRRRWISAGSRVF